MSRARSGSSADLPVCGEVFQDTNGSVISCRERGSHLCEPRAARVIAFFAEILVHTKGDWARRRFDLQDWQRDDIIRPLFGTVRWDDERLRYVRQYRMAWIELGRKNGKSELGAGFALYLLVGDGEESAEVYGAAKDTKQAGKVAEVAARMLVLSPELSARDGLGVNKANRRIYDLQTGGYYEVATADAGGELGHNPHGIVFDEVLTQPNDKLWNALRTSMGARAQPLMVGFTTATDDPSSFCAKEHEEMLRVAEDRTRSPHTFVYMRNTPRDADPWDENNWQHANPALGQFLSISALREEALEARNDPTKENSFRQFRLNQHVQQTTRWMPLHLWDACAGLVDEQQLVGHRCYGGLDLSSKYDLTSIAYVFPDDNMSVLWRFWVPEEQIRHLDQHTGGKASVWVRQGFLRATAGAVIDYEQVHNEITADSRRFKLMDISHDRWMATPTVQELEKRKIQMFPVGQGYIGMAEPMKEIMRLIRGREITHGGNPVARWNADAVEVKRDDADNIKPVKPDRDKSGKRIDGIVALAMSLDGVMRRGRKRGRGQAVGF